MKPTTLLLALLPALSLAQDGLDCFNNICCINGAFSGPVISSFSASFSASFSSLDASRSASEASRGAALTSSLAAAAASRSASEESVQSSLAVKFSTQDAAAMVTPRAVFRRAITTEVSPGLTCIGDAVSTESGYSATTTEASGSAMGAGATSPTSSSTAGAAVMTQAPILAVGAAAALFAYGQMYREFAFYVFENAPPVLEYFED
ncbi:hypothetical protein L207DRAFT_598634 [Hyaloscypha variabilis F]|uniref:Uncharacterized protein n=1 Tax=Hyaloscypha variabilis (strain UAMH 11265 / GT02V1 / F) TaxID=1149755 RepID=A0A2J6RHS0_HYAVF|nr:hypothetical protein L207DRAFT_598634 [Hyaloscypha variabilis F]